MREEEAVGSDDGGGEAASRQVRTAELLANGAHRTLKPTVTEQQSVLRQEKKL